MRLAGFLLPFSAHSLFNRLEGIMHPVERKRPNSVENGFEIAVTAGRKGRVLLRRSTPPFARCYQRRCVLKKGGLHILPNRLPPRDFVDREVIGRSSSLIQRPSRKCRPPSVDGVDASLLFFFLFHFISVPHESNPG